MLQILMLRSLSTRGHSATSFLGTHVWNATRLNSGFRVYFFSTCSIGVPSEPSLCFAVCVKMTSLDLQLGCHNNPKHIEGVLKFNGK